MAHNTKKAKLSKVLIRLCDAFTRTDGNIICPLIKAESSVRVLYKLKEKVLYKAVQEAGAGIGFTDPTFLWKSAATGREMDGNLFLEYSTSQRFNDNLKQYRETLARNLKEVSKVKHILIDKVEDTDDIIPQPIISEMDFEMHKLEFCCKELAKINDPDIKDAIDDSVGKVRENLEEVKKRPTKIAVLSQNGKGKSFFLNLLLLMTSDNEEEYRENNRKLLLPEVKSFIGTNNMESKKFKPLMRSICQNLYFDDFQDLGTENASFRSIPAYFTEKKMFQMEPYLLAQKTIEKCYESTTKCNVHLRYGTVYQLKVEYFSAKELQIQLFELVSKKNETENTSDTCLKARFAALTNYDISDDCLKSIKSYEEINLSEKTKQLVGKTELYIGGGKDSAKDRLALKKILSGLASSQDEDDSDEETWKCRVAAVKEIVVYIPSKILYNKEIMEMPGSDDSDSLAKHFIEKALEKVEGICLMSEYGFKIVEKEIKAILLQSEFTEAWKKNPELYALMLLSYSEKDFNYHFGKDDLIKMKNLEVIGIKRKSKELEELKNLLAMDSFSVEQSIFSTLVLPVLHTSIHAQEGQSNTVIAENAEFLKYTGIQNLIVKLDTFVSTRAPKHSLELKNQLSRLSERQCRELTPDEAKSVLQLYRKKEVKDTRINALARNHQDLCCSLKKQLTDMYKKTLHTKVDLLLVKTVEEAKKRWETSQYEIKKIEMFNPMYRHKGKLSKIIFGDLASHKAEIFKILMEEIDRALGVYKNGFITLLTEELKESLTILKLEHVDSEAFVKQTIEEPLAEALEWYKGKQKMPIVEKKISEFWENSKRESLIKYILEPAYKQNDLDRAKEKANQNISKALNNTSEYLIEELLDLHDIRWKSLTSHLNSRKRTPQMWNILIGRIKSISTNTEDGVNVALFNVLKLVNITQKNIDLES
ncbi:hypothetical protein XENTR_v10000409 [Xenopus tropicalis]|nr:hypothetical protein XENTR_v10000409 [Xenopus tropicalis]